MSLKNPFLWRDTNKTMNKESTLLPNINKINLLASNSINNTKIKNIQDQISVYESKIFKMENTLFKKEEELRVKEKMLKDCQRRKTRQNKEERQKKHFNVMISFAVAAVAGLSLAAVSSWWLLLVGASAIDSRRPPSRSACRSTRWTCTSARRPATSTTTATSTC